MIQIQDWGGVFVVVGLVLCIGGFVLAIYQQSVAKKATKEQTKALGPDAIKEILDSIPKILEQFAKLAMPMQFSVLGLALMIIGMVLLLYKPS